MLRLRLRAGKLLGHHLTMRILALETSGRGGSVALLHGEAAAAKADAVVLQARTLDAAERPAKTLHGCAQSMLAEQGWRAKELELICVAVGPGSFTGLRIGVVAAKTLAYATGATLAAVPTLAAIAEGVARSPWESGYGRCSTPSGRSCSQRRSASMTIWPMVRPPACESCPRTSGWPTFPRRRRRGTAGREIALAAFAERRAGFARFVEPLGRERGPARLSHGEERPLVRSHDLTAVLLPAECGGGKGCGKGLNGRARLLPSRDVGGVSDADYGR